MQPDGREGRRRSRRKTEATAWQAPPRHSQGPPSPAAAPAGGRARPPWPLRAAGARAAPPRPDRAGARRPRHLPRFVLYLGRRAARWGRPRRTPCASCSVARPSWCRRPLLAAGAILVCARCCPACARSAPAPSACCWASRSAWPPGPLGLGPDAPRTTPLLGPRLRLRPRRRAGRAALRVDAHALLGPGRPHPVRVPDGWRGPAGDRRVHRRRRERHERAGHHHHEARAPPRVAADHRSAAGRERPARGHRGDPRHAPEPAGRRAGGARHPRGGARARRRGALPGPVRARAGRADEPRAVERRRPDPRRRGATDPRRTTRRRWRRSPTDEAGAAHADGQPPHRRDRGRRHRLRPAPRRPSSSARTAKRSPARPPTSAWAPSSWSPSATSAWRPKSWAA